MRHEKGGALLRLIGVVCILQIGLYGQGQAQDFEVLAKSHIVGGQGIFKDVKLDYTDLRISSQHRSATSGITHIYLQQLKEGLDIFKAVGSIHINKKGQIIHETNQFLIAKNYKLFSAARIALEEAVNTTAQHFALETANLNAISTPKNKAEKQVFRHAGLSSEEMFAKQVYLPVNNSLHLTWNISFEKKDDRYWWNVFVDAANGQLLKTESWTVECAWGDKKNHSLNRMDNPLVTNNKSPSSSPSTLVSNAYRVYQLPVEAPNDGERILDTSPWLRAPNASPYGWHDTDGVAGPEFTDTRGNNVMAQDDFDSNNTGGMRPDGGTSLEFDFPIDLTMDPDNYVDAATVNLFYINNILHDILYQYGFDENAGNFQLNNYGKGGLGNDFVYADVQDGSGTNNATFSTVPEGLNPRMQMFVWVPSIGSATIDITSPSSIAQTFHSSKASFGQQTGMVSGTLVRTVPDSACTTLTNAEDINGNIAVITRGDCFFDTKVDHAESAGAIAAIVCNHTPGAGVLTMGGDGAPVVDIPSAMLSYEQCELIDAEMPGVTAEMTFVDQPLVDSDLDNGIIVHEYVHGLSNRLTGGKDVVGCLANAEQMGEGWSDYFALMFTMKENTWPKDARGIGTYVEGDAITGVGIRLFPYSIDLEVNPLTYDFIKGFFIVHDIGMIWCTMLWEMTWNLILKHGFDSDLYYGNGGNNMAILLVTEAMKLQPCSPGFVDGRDAILLADQNLYNGANQCEIWRAFAKRGLGFSASQGSSDDVNDGSEAFDLPPSLGCELDPCTTESVTYADTSIPDGTIERVEETISLNGNVTVPVNAAINFQYGYFTEIFSTFQLETGSSLTIIQEPCDPSAVNMELEAEQAKLKNRQSIKYPKKLR